MTHLICKSWIASGKRREHETEMVRRTCSTGRPPDATVTLIARRRRYFPQRGDLFDRHLLVTSLVSPDGYNLDNYYMTRPGAHEVQLDLFLDYASNLEMYPISCGNSYPAEQIPSTPGK
jgi:hypothetical protein